MKKSVSGFLAGIAFFTLLLGCVFPSRADAQTNLISNGNMELGKTGWQVWGATLSVSSDAHGGSNALLVSNRKNPWDAAVIDITTLLKNGTTYKLGAWLKLSGPGTNFRATIQLKVDGNTTYMGYMRASTPVVGSYAYYSEVIPFSWTGTLEQANLYFETEASGGIYPDYLLDDVSLVEQAPEIDAMPDYQGLNSIRTQMLMGGCVNEGSEKNYFHNEAAKANVLHNSTVATVQCYPAWGRWDETMHHVYHLDEFNTQVRQMKEQGLLVTAHMLMGWDQYLPDWYRLNDFPADTLDAILKSWVHTIAGYKGNDTLVDTWNVVNEAISWDGKGSYWPLNAADQKSACEMQRIGYEPDSSGLSAGMIANATHPVYIRRAFEYARQITTKKLELRDASIEFPTDSKYKAFYQLAAHLKKVGAPVDVIGFQTHIDIEQQYDWDGYVNNIKRYRQLGYQVNITEVDIGDVAKSWNEEKAALQKMMYYRLVSSAIKGGAAEFHTWGFIDDGNKGWRYGESAFPFTHTFEPKPAFFGMREALIDMSQVLFWEMDAMSNSSMPDVMLKHNDGQAVNMGSPVFTVGFKYKALQFDGQDDYLRTDELADTVTGDFTFTCFFKTSATSGGILADLGKSEQSGIKVGIDNAGMLKLFKEGAGLTNDLLSTSAVNDGQWHYLAMQRDSNMYYLYLDAAVPTDSGAGTIDTIGRLYAGAAFEGASPYAGLLDEVKLYATRIEAASFSRSMLPFCPLKPTLTQKGMVMRFGWTDQSINEDGFLIERKTGNGPWEELKTVGKVIAYIDTVDLYSTSYSYRVRAINRFGKSEPSMSKSATTPADPHTGYAQLNAPGDIRLEVYPNPCSTSFTVSCSKPSILRMYDMNGSLLFSLSRPVDEWTFPVENLPPGIYFLRGSSQTSTSLVKILHQ